MTTLQKPLPDCTIFLLAKAYQRAHGIFKAQLAPYGLTNLQHLVLEGLWYQEGQTAAELGKMLVLDKATLSGVIDRLVDGEWIEKRRDPSDGRVQRLYTANKSAGLKNELIALRQRANADLLAVLPLGEQALLKRMLRDLMQDGPHTG
ncbi:MAG: MarR family transcriptional regulator [Pseudomonadota bacterium]